MDRLGRSVQRLTTSSNALSEASAEHHRKVVLASERAKLMLDCYRTGGANNPETFVTAVAATLARYPDEVIYAVTDPTTGIPVQITWMPSIKEVNDACAKAHEPIVQNEIRLKRIREQMEMRERMDRGEKPTLDQLKEKYGENWGLERLKSTKTAEEKREESRIALERSQARIRAEYIEAGLNPPESKFALSLSARRLMAEQDAARGLIGAENGEELVAQLKRGIGPSTAG
ncbi:hypothetical protein ABIE91_009559 [Bradyrhizobium elkanii]